MLVDGTHERVDIGKLAGLLPLTLKQPLQSQQTTVLYLYLAAVRQWPVDLHGAQCKART